MKVVFLGTFFNHHQKALSDALASGCHYTYIATSSMPQMRIRLGYQMDVIPRYVCQYESDTERAMACMKEADVIIAGSAPEKLIQQCIRRGQYVFRYQERPLKNGMEFGKYLPRLVKWHWLNPAGRPVYMLCASAYTAGDYAKFGLFRGRTFRWGYFPELYRYENHQSLMKKKEKATILWAGRYLDWKHPDDGLIAAKELKKAGLEFTLRFIGTGEMEDKLREMTEQLGLGDRVEFLGTMKPEAVRRHMERSQIFLFTSDRKEGWGAVLNEAMNSGCCVIASRLAGAVPYLIKDGENGLLYECGDIEDLTEKIKTVLLQPRLRFEMGIKAYKTIAELWNAEVAAERFLKMAHQILRQEPVDYPSDGPCSRAPALEQMPRQSYGRDSSQRNSSIQ